MGSTCLILLIAFPLKNQVFFLDAPGFHFSRKIRKEAILKFFSSP